MYDITSAAGSNDRVYIDVNGNVGLGTVAPAYPLDAAGMTRVCAGSNPILFSSSWQASTDVGTSHAEISNDTSTYKTLMIVGNRSNNGGVRSVSVWDMLTVNGALAVTGGATVSAPLSVTGNATLGSSASNVHTLNGSVNVTQGTTVGATLSVAGNATLGSGASNSHTLNGSVNVTQGATVGTLTVNGAAGVGGNATIGGTASITGAATLGNNLYVSGNVGIGTPTPQAKLEVNGAVMVSSATANAHQGTTLKGLPYASFSVAAIAALQEMKRAYDARIQALEERIAALSARA